MARKISKIYWHCSASRWGTLEDVVRWHIQRGWRTIGYHGLIGNQFPTWTNYKEQIAVPEHDGKFFIGRPIDDDLVLDEDEVGAHVKGENSFSLGLCLIGDELFGQKQIDSALQATLAWMRKYEVEPDMVRGHYEHWEDQGLPPQKTCPNLNMKEIRAQLRKLAVA